MKGYGTISAFDVFKFRLSLGKGWRIEANLFIILLCAGKHMLPLYVV
jgi:hypothetical protein